MYLVYCLCFYLTQLYLCTVYILSFRNYIQIKDDHYMLQHVFPTIFQQMCKMQIHCAPCRFELAASRQCSGVFFMSEWNVVNPAGTDGESAEWFLISRLCLGFFFLTNWPHLTSRWHTHPNMWLWKLPLTCWFWMHVFELQIVVYLFSSLPD